MTGATDRPTRAPDSRRPGAGRPEVRPPDARPPGWPQLWGLPIELLVALLAMAVSARDARDWGRSDLDVFWHVRAGQYVWTHGLLHAEPWVWPRLGLPILHHEWLSQLLLWTLWRLGGGPALALAVSALFAGLLYTLLRLVRPHLPAWACALLGVWLLFALRLHLLPRPHLATYVGVLVVTWALRTRHPTGLPAPGAVGAWRQAGLWALGMSLWMNLHSGALLGLALVAGSLLGDVLDWGWQRLGAERGPRDLAGAPAARVRAGTATLAAAAVGTLATPWGLQGWTHAAQVGRDPYFRLLFQEFYPLARAGQYDLGLLAIWAGGLALLLCRRRTLEGWQLGVLAPAMLAALVSVRHLPLWCMVVAVVLSPTLRLPAWARSPVGLPGRGGRAWRLEAAVATVALCLAGGWITRAAAEGGRWQLAPNPGTWAVGPVRALVAMGPTAGRRPINGYADGTVMLWERFGQPVFMDTRGDAHGGPYVADGFDLIAARAGWWRPQLEHWQPDAIILERRMRLWQVLRQDPAWKAAYCDSTAVLLVRAGDARARGVSCVPVALDTALVPRPPAGTDTVPASRVPEPAARPGPPGPARPPTARRACGAGGARC